MLTTWYVSLLGIQKLYWVAVSLILLLLVDDLDKETVAIEWCPPNGSDIKVNFDAAFDEAQALSASKVVARNSSGEILASKTMVHRGVASSFAAEAHTCLQAILLGKRKGFSLVAIEGDSVSIIKKS